MSAKEGPAESRDSRRGRLVRAGLRGAGLVRRLEGLAASAARDRVGVAEREAAAHEGVDEVDLRALEIHGAHRVYDNANVIPYENPEHPPGVTYTRSARSCRSCFERTSRSLSVAFGVSETSGVETS